MKNGLNVEILPRKQMRINIGFYGNHRKRITYLLRYSTNYLIDHQGSIYESYFRLEVGQHLKPQI